MARKPPLQERQENIAFCRALNRTGNVKLAAEQVGVDHSVFYRRRARDPDFRHRWEVAMMTGPARLKRSGRSAVAAKSSANPLRATGGEAVVVRAANGRMQVRRAHPGTLTKACEQAFLQALAATANIALSAAAAGASVNAFYLRRQRNPAFAREMRAALAMGYERVEGALLEGWMPTSGEDDRWRHNEPLAVPKMTANQALQLLYLHQKEARFHEERPDRKRRRKESGDAHSARLGELYLEKLARGAEHMLLIEVLKNAKTSSYRHEVPPLASPALDQVTGWSRADPTKKPRHEDRALFGGWRMEDWEGG